MSFDRYKTEIEEGDTVVLYISANALYNLVVKKTIKNKYDEDVDYVYQTTYGALKVSDLIGVKFGTKVNLSIGWAYVLHPTPELWTVTLPHRTQIIYTPDISMIVFQLEISPGSNVIESGTGSGSLTHALARCVAPSGFVYTFDFHEKRVSLATEEFKFHKIDSVVSVKQRDVCKDGFGEELFEKADAVFLDLPHPWLVVQHAVKALKEKGGRFCSFSPCIEQIQKTCQALREEGFVEINTIECLQRELLVNTRKLPIVNISGDNDNTEKEMYSFSSSNYAINVPGHTGYLTSATLPPKKLL